MSTKTASFAKMTIKEGKMDDAMAKMKEAVDVFSGLPGVLSMTFAKTGERELRSLAIYDSPESLEKHGVTLKKFLAECMPMFEEGGFERAIGEIVANA
jgi:hypothetical protein